MDIEIKIENISIIQKEEIKEYINIYAEYLFLEYSNPIEKIIVTQNFEKDLHDLYSLMAHSINRIKFNIDRSVRVMGKTLPFIKNGEIKFYILINILALSLPELFHLVYKGVKD